MMLKTFSKRINLCSLQKQKERLLKDLDSTPLDSHQRIEREIRIIESKQQFIFQNIAVIVSISALLGSLLAIRQETLNFRRENRPYLSITRGLNTQIDQKTKMIIFTAAVENSGSSPAKLKSTKMFGCEKYLPYQADQVPNNTHITIPGKNYIEHRFALKSEILQTSTAHDSGAICSIRFDYSSFFNEEDRYWTEYTFKVETDARLTTISHLMN